MAGEPTDLTLHRMNALKRHVDNRFEAVDGKLDTIIDLLSHMDAKMAVMQVDMNVMSKRLAAIEDGVDPWAEDSGA